MGKKGEEDGRYMCQRKVGKVRGGGQRWGENVEGRQRSGIVSEEDYRYTWYEWIWAQKFRSTNQFSDQPCL